MANHPVTATPPGNYKAVAASQTDSKLSGGKTSAGAAGDYLEGLTVIVATAATAAVSIKDGGGSAISMFPNAPGGGIGTYYVPVKAFSVTGAWSVTTGAGSSVFATGRFS